MSHNRIYKPGPTLEECDSQDITHLRLTCHDCRNEKVVAVADVRARRNVPVNHIRFRCACKSLNISVSAIRKDEVQTPHPIFDLTGVKAKSRRWPMPVVRKSRSSE